MLLESSRKALAWTSSDSQGSTKLSMSVSTLHGLAIIPSLSEANISINTCSCRATTFSQVNKQRDQLLHSTVDDYEAYLRYKKIDEEIGRVGEKEREKCFHRLMYSSEQ
jgi:hypothetical protein